jgi:hypothetical protein
VQEIQRRLSRGDDSRKVVAVYNVSRLFSFNPRLAKEYALRESWNEGAAKAVCLRNGVVAARAGRLESAKLWGICSQVAETAMTYARQKKGMDADVIPLSNHPMGRPLLMSVMRHLLSRHDIQGRNSPNYSVLVRDKFVLYGSCLSQAKPAIPTNLVITDISMTTKNLPDHTASKSVFWHYFTAYTLWLRANGEFPSASRWLPSSPAYSSRVRSAW